MPNPVGSEETSPEILEVFDKAFPARRGFGVMPEPDGTEAIDERLDVIEEKIDALTAKLELIFGKSILIKGRFIEL